MDVTDIYRWFMGGAATGICDAFDAHVLASALSLGLVEATAEGASVVSTVGIEATPLTALVGATFPHARPMFERLDPAERLHPAIDEACLRDLLERSATAGSSLETALALIVARRAQRPNHLWQDLGLRHRRELSWLMSRHFEPLAARNTGDMKWKKFLYRTICRDDSFPICTSPTCTECSDYDGCFGDEKGETLLPAISRPTPHGKGRG